MILLSDIVNAHTDMYRIGIAVFHPKFCIQYQPGEAVTVTGMNEYCKSITVYSPADLAGIFVLLQGLPYFREQHISTPPAKDGVHELKVLNVEPDELVALSLMLLQTFLYLSQKSFPVV
jgi:hypothetical protein